MHMADALVSPAVAGTMYACSAAVAALSIRKVHIENDPKKMPVMGVMGAFVFAAQMINFTIPGTGSSGHLCGGMLLSALVGPWAGFLTMIGVLLIQCLFFADGGLLALGCNVWNMAFYGCFIGTLLIWNPIMRRKITKKKIVFASVLGCVLTLQLGAFSVSVETVCSGVTELPFAAFAATMQPIHLAIGLVEGLITAAVLVFVYEARPELLFAASRAGERKNRFSCKKVLVILAAAAGIIGFGLSRLASVLPDGLEWSIKQLTGSTELEASGGVYDGAAALQDATAVFPDYALKSADSPAGYIAAAVVGLAVLVACCIVICYLVKHFRDRKRRLAEKSAERAVRGKEQVL